MVAEAPAGFFCPSKQLPATLEMAILPNSSPASRVFCRIHRYVPGWPSNVVAQSLVQEDLLIFHVCGSRTATKVSMGNVLSGAADLPSENKTLGR